MMTMTEETALTVKTRELCQTILEQPDFLAVRRQIDAFMADEDAKQQYQSLVEKSEMLNHKQHQGVQLTSEEIDDFQRHRETVISNPVAQGFIDAQKEMHSMQESISQYVAKTFELGRLPEAEDFESGSCGHGCGCHH